MPYCVASAISRSGSARRSDSPIAATASKIRSNPDGETRWLPVPKLLLEGLETQIAGKSPDDLVFSSPHGSYLRVGNFRRGYFDKAARAIGQPGLYPHELRHTAASLAIAAGATVKSVQRMLGHASATLTLDHYGHLFADELDDVAARLDDAMRDSDVVPMWSQADPAFFGDVDREAGDGR